MALKLLSIQAAKKMEKQGKLQVCKGRRRDIAQAAPYATRRARMHGLCCTLIHVCMVLLQLASQPAKAGTVHTRASSKPVVIGVLKPDSVATYIADGEPYGDPLPGVYDAGGVDVYGVESIVPTIRDSRKLLHGCHASSGCATSSLC